MYEQDKRITLSHFIVRPRVILETDLNVERTC